MDSNEYSKLALRTTDEKKFHGELISNETLRSELFKVLRTSERLDHFKRALFYGKEPPTFVAPISQNEHNGNETARVLPAFIERREHFIHGLLGAITEIGELVELQLNGNFTKVQGAEEIGDLLWYMNLLIVSLGLTWPEVMTANIAKLEARYPEKFTAEKALNRDLQAESVALTSAVLGDK